MLSDNPRTRIVWMFVNSDVLEPTDGTLIVSQEFFSASGILKQRPVVEIQVWICTCMYMR